MMLTACRFIAYYGTLACFGLGAVALNACCAVCGSGRGHPRRERFFQRVIHRFLRAVTRAAAGAGLIQIEYRGCGPLAAGAKVLVANHPGLLDVVYLLAQVPTAVCIFKPAVRCNPLFGPAAASAGYLASDRQLTLVRSGVAQLAAGATLIVFPEGTRTPSGGQIGAFKPGFALIARRARAPVQLVRISVEGRLLTKDHVWWKLPRLPASVLVQAGPCLDSTAAASTAEFVADVEAWFRGRPAATPRREFEALPAASSSITLTAS